MRTLLLFSLLFTAAACDSAGPCPLAEATPSVLTWTDLALGVAAEEAVSVSNDCSGKVSLSVSVGVDDPRFSVAPADLSIAPGEVGTFVVTASVADYEKARGTLTLVTNDPASPSLTVALSASAAADQDGDGSAHGEDCDDLDASVYPGATEVCDDAIDQDCNGDLECRPRGSYSLATTSAKLTGAASVDQAGYSFDVGDLNGDGYADVLVGAWLNDAAGADAGAAYLVYGPVSGTLSLSAADATWTGEAAGDQAGLGVAVAGDVDGDGLADALIGASFAGDGGMAYLVYNASIDAGGSLAAADVSFLGEEWSDEAGLAVAPAGDVDADGYADILVGAYANDAADSNAGAAYLLYGPLAAGSLDLAGADAKLTGEGHGDEAGHDLAAAGDVDGDGFGDLLIGAPADDDGGTDAGAAYLVLGPPAAGVSALGDAEAKLVGPDVSPSGMATADRSLLGAVDLNDDGFDDVIVSSCGGGTGAAYLVYGPFAGVLDLGTADVVFTGEDDGDGAGSAPSAGDVDGDGALDLVLGAPGAESGGPTNDQVGFSYLLYGPFAGSYDLAAADITLVGEDEEDYAGFTNGLADVDGDSLADILVGAIGDDDGGNYAGAVYLYYAADL